MALLAPHKYCCVSQQLHHFRCICMPWGGGRKALNMSKRQNWGPLDFSYT